MRNNYRYLFFIAGTICLTFVGCGNKNNNQTAGNQTSNQAPAVDIISPMSTPSVSPSVQAGKEFFPTAENVKLLGRTYQLLDTLWLSLSASGIEFTFTGTKADITLIGDNMAINPSEDTHYCRIGVYVNDELVSDELLKEKEKTITAFESGTEKTVIIRVIKLSETADSTVGISKITTNPGAIIQPTEAKAHRIEFIGDSITCGYGVDARDENEAYTTATEDVTKAYAYETAKALDADYSMFSISGYGIISGYTGNGTINTSQLIPDYYDTMGFSYGYFNGGIRTNSVNWDFTRFVPELIVINLGTNDSSYCGNDSARQADFAAGYLTFLKHVREKNPNATILCTLGIMGDILYPSIEGAVNQYSRETGDTNIKCMKFDAQLSSDGYGASWHPSPITHTKAAEKLTAEIKQLMGW
jgi:lysophospholipase L1-like esterase